MAVWKDEKCYEGDDNIMIRGKMKQHTVHYYEVTIVQICSTYIYNNFSLGDCHNVKTSNCYHKATVTVLQP